MGLKERVLDLIREKCEKGLEIKLRIHELVGELYADEEEVTRVVQELEREGVVEYKADELSEPYIYPVMSPEDMLKKRIIDLVNAMGKTDVYEIALLLGEDRTKIEEVVIKLQEEGKIEFVSEAGSGWVKPA